MITVFERIPDVFVQVYDHQFQIWAREFRQRGPRCAFLFKRIGGEPIILDPATGKPAPHGAWLEAEIDRSKPEPRMVVRPATENDAALIEEHCHKLRPHVLQ